MIKLAFINLKSTSLATFRQKTWGNSYFLEIEVVQSNSDVVISQRKYTLNILEETGMLDYKLVDIPMDLNVKLVPG